MGTLIPMTGQHLSKVWWIQPAQGREPVGRPLPDWCGLYHLSRLALLSVRRSSLGRPPRWRPDLLPIAFGARFGYAVQNLFQTHRPELRTPVVLPRRGQLI